MAKEKKGRSIFHVTLVPLLSVLAIEMALLFGILLFGGVFQKLDQNAQAMLAQQVENRGNYLLNEMIGNWSNLEPVSKVINQEVQERMEQGQLSLDDLNGNSENAVELLKALNPKLIEVMYNKQVSGIYVILNTKDLNGAEIPEVLAGIYLRDLDPTSTPSEMYADILLERSPKEVVQSGYIATDTGWQPAFSRKDSVEQDYFYKPFQTAYEDESTLQAKEYGYWTTQPYQLTGDNRKAISYSVPLILEDGTVYGVLGVELLEEYVQSMLPYSELMEKNQGVYVLAVVNEPEGTYIPVTMSGISEQTEGIGKVQFRWDEEKERVPEEKTDSYHATAKPLIVYSRNAPFDADKWYLMGIASKDNLFAFSRQVQTTLLAAAALILFIGLAGILLVSYNLSKPIKQLSKEVEQSKNNKNSRLSKLTDTGIREIDRFADEIIHLWNEVMDSSTRFLSIMDMVSVELAGFELRDDSDEVFVTDNYFPLLGENNIDIKELTAQEFREKQKETLEKLQQSQEEDGSVLYSVVLDDGSIRYLHSECKKDGVRNIGLIEDVTASTLEKMQIERERDCDGLTKLYGRRGFKREADELFLQPERLKQAALLMMDLDNLKTINDKFGHNFGDLYIQTAGRCFVDNTPEQTICARISGDEFLVLFYGYDNQDEIRERLQHLYQAIQSIDFVMPNGKNMGLSASGGVAWYPGDSVDLSELMKYADFAMYQVKQSKKGELKEFDAEAYQQKLYMNQCRLELHQVLDQKNVNYHFQPIFSSKTGEVYAYEALMRVDTPSLRSPATVLQLAKEMDRMHDIECITMFRTLECFEKLLKEQNVADDALIFINSIANECMNAEEEKEFRGIHNQLLSKIVVEITEEENLDMELMDRKRCFSDMFALDDYGSGYNSEINLLELRPNFVKVDITIIRDIDKDINKQQIVENLVDYAHRRNMMVVAEGLETEEEVCKVLDLGVDLLQGYYLARPGAVPPVISEDAKQMIEAYWKQ